MTELTFKTISKWRCSNVTIAALLKWCDVNCEGSVLYNSTTLIEAFEFNIESDATLFALRWN